MCIICVKPAGVAMPNNETIFNMWQGNSDGAGLAYWRSNENAVYIDKGFMKLKMLRAKLNDLNLGRDDMAILHFRWATHGITDGGNCHPFPLSSKIDALRALNGAFPTAIAHNGVFGSMPNHDTLSDTQKFIAKIMCNPAIVGNLDNPAIRELISGYCGSASKLAILRPGKLTFIGEFCKDDTTGLIYSNEGFKKKSYHCASYRAMDDDDDYISPVKEAIKGIVNKCCEMCKSEKDICYVDEYQLFMCMDCLEHHLATQSQYAERRARQEHAELMAEYEAEEALLAEGGHAND